MTTILSSAARREVACSRSAAVAVPQAAATTTGARRIASKAEPIPLLYEGRVVTAKRDRANADAEHAGTQLAYHGPGLTFGELAIGECFYWPPPIPRGPEPMVKSGDQRYEWSRGYGTAEAYYRVEAAR